MRAFQKLNSEQKRVWTYLGGFVVVGSVAKVSVPFGFELVP